MEKYLFTDGTNLVREVQSKEELYTLIQSSGDSGKIRIWIFSTSEWISYTEFSKRSIAGIPPAKKTAIAEEKKNNHVAVKKPVKKGVGVIRFFVVLVTSEIGRAHV